MELFWKKLGKMSAHISIIIPTKNAERHIKKCLESILDQSYIDFEIIVVDYKSNDKTQKIILDFDKQKIKCIESQKSGIYHAMNLGVKNAIGEYCLFLGADDLLSEASSLEDIFKLNPKTDIILGKVQNINRSTIKIKSIYENKFSKSLYWRNTVHHQGVFYKRDLLLDNIFNEKYEVLADYDLNLRLLKKNISQTYFDVNISKSDASGLSKNFTKELYMEELELKKETVPSWAFLINTILVRLKFIIKG